MISVPQFIFILLIVQAHRTIHIIQFSVFLDVTVIPIPINFYRSACFRFTLSLAPRWVCSSAGPHTLSPGRCQRNVRFIILYIHNVIYDPDGHQFFFPTFGLLFPYHSNLSVHLPRSENCINEFSIISFAFPPVVVVLVVSNCKRIVHTHVNLINLLFSI